MTISIRPLYFTLIHILLYKPCSSIINIGNNAATLSWIYETNTIIFSLDINRIGWFSLGFGSGVKIKYYKIRCVMSTWF